MADWANGPEAACDEKRGMLDAVLYVACDLSDCASDGMYDSGS
jgi:hypothetical protein